MPPDPLDELAEYLRWRSERDDAFDNQFARWLLALEGVRKDARRYLAIRNDVVNVERLFARATSDERMVDVESMRVGADLDSAIDAALKDK